jgi:general nucleoside transport system permease protein
MNDGLLVELLSSGVLYGTPFVIAALGELLAERSGVLNLGVEGMMLMGAVMAFLVSQNVGGAAWTALLLAIVVAAVTGSALALIHAVAAVTLRVNQIVSGLALTILGGSIGLSTLTGQAADLTGQPGRHRLPPIDVLGLGDLPLLGPVVFRQNVLVYVSWAMVIAVALYLNRTRFGLHLRSVGDDPKAADAMGVSVARYRYVHTVAGGAFAGIGGAYYTLAIAPNWNAGMTAGAGWIAVALVIFAFWRPGLILVGAYLFGTVSGLGFTLQARDVDLPPQLFSALPYLVTIFVLVVASARLKGQLVGPSALGVAYSREDS